VIARAHAKGIAVYGATLTPFEGAGYYSPEKDVVRQAVNNWIRSSDEFDGVIDFDRATRDPAIRPASCRPMTAAITCTRTTSGTRRWGMRCRWSCSVRWGLGICGCSRRRLLRGMENVVSAAQSSFP
jgi:hypothetical protein